MMPPKESTRDQFKMWQTTWHDLDDHELDANDGKPAAVPVPVTSAAFASDQAQEHTTAPAKRETRICNYLGCTMSSRNGTLLCACQQRYHRDCAMQFASLTDRGQKCALCSGVRPAVLEVDDDVSLDAGSSKVIPLQHFWNTPNSRIPPLKTARPSCRRPTETLLPVTQSVRTRLLQPRWCAL